jgi:hypothetical protein
MERIMEKRMDVWSLLFVISVIVLDIGPYLDGTASIQCHHDTFRSSELKIISKRIEPGGCGALNAARPAFLSSDHQTNTQENKIKSKATADTTAQTAGLES